MAEIEGTNAPGQPAAPAAPATPEAPKQPESQSQPTQGEEQWFVPGKFKTAEDMKKSYDGLESKLGEMGDKYGTLEATLATQSAILNAITSSQQGAETPETPGEQQPAAPVESPKVGEIERTMRIDTITRFDQKFGIKEEEIKDVHKKVGEELAALGYDVKTAPLDLLPSLLEKGFRLAYAERANEKERLAGAAQNMTNMQAAVPSQGGGSISPGEGTPQLDQEQLDWVKKLGFTESDVQKHYKAEASK